MFGLTKAEMRVFRKLSSPARIQTYLNTLPFNHEKGGETNYSPREVLKKKRAHCMEGALLATAALWFHGKEPLLLDLKSARGDDDHVVALYKERGYWGAISKTNHAVLRYRDPIYKTVRELALSYFHEYFLNKTGKKTLRSYSQPFRLKRLGTSWITAPEPLFDLAKALDASPHLPLLSKRQEANLRPADAVERKAGTVVEWKK